VVLSILSGLGFGSYWALTHWDFFALKKIEIQGDPKTISEAEVLKRAGLRVGENLFAIRLEEIHQRLQGHEYFKQISVQRRLPRTLVIQVQEYQTQFLLYTGRFYYIGRDGEIFRDITESKESRDFPVLTGLSEEDLLQRPLWVKDVLSQAVGLKSKYLASDFADRFGLSEIHFQKNIGFTLYPEKQKYSIKFGVKDFGEKTRKLTQVLEKLEHAEVKFSSIDLNYPGKVLMTL
jgi:cell division septal protein FtsQ